MTLLVRGFNDLGSSSGAWPNSSRGLSRYPWHVTVPPGLPVGRHDGTPADLVRAAEIGRESGLATSMPATSRAGWGMGEHPLPRLREPAHRAPRLPCQRGRPGGKRPLPLLRPRHSGPVAGPAGASAVDVEDVHPVRVFVERGAEQRGQLPVDPFAFEVVERIPVQEIVVVLLEFLFEVVDEKIELGVGDRSQQHPFVGVGMHGEKLCLAHRPSQGLYVGITRNQAGP